MFRRRSRSRLLTEMTLIYVALFLLVMSTAFGCAAQVAIATGTPCEYQGQLRTGMKYHCEADTDVVVDLERTSQEPVWKTILAGLSGLALTIVTHGLF